MRDKANTTVKESGRNWVYICIPDTVDPREAKAAK